MNGDSDEFVGLTDNSFNGSTSQPLKRIEQALQIVYDPNSINESRKEAGAFLEGAKSDKEAPYHGFKLAHNRALDAFVRHFGLLLLENAIRYYWQEYAPAEMTAVRDWVISLAGTVSSNDPAYLRNKIAQLWVEVAKRSWPSDWANMDELLVNTWDNATRQPDTAQRDMVLFILETLVDDVFNREDSAAGLRNTPLTKGCFDIFTPQSVFVTHYPQRVESSTPRCGQDGWLLRLVRLLDDALMAGRNNHEAMSCCIRILAVLKACMSWSIPKAIAAANIVESVGRSLVVQSTAVQMAATECLHSLYTKPFFDDEEFESLVCPMFLPQSTELLKNIFSWLPVDPTDIDEERYLFLKRFSEMIADLGGFLEERSHPLPEQVDLPGFLSLSFMVASHDSLAISIPVMNLWAKLLKSEKMARVDAIQQFNPRLLELATTRFIRYEALGDDSQDRCVLFLNEDLDTIPERHAFLGNYRRFCSSLVENITKRRPFEVFPFIMSNAESTISTLYESSPFSFKTYQKNSGAFLRIDAQFSVIEAALRGYCKWNDTQAVASGVSQAGQEFERNLESWCQQILNQNFEDPMIKRRVIQLMVTFSTTALNNKPELMLQVLEHILLTRPTEHHLSAAYTDAVKELATVCTTEIQRLAMKMPDHLMVVYDQLEHKVNEIITDHDVDDRTKIAFHTFLFTINHRAKSIDPQLQLHRLENYILPIRQSWAESSLSSPLQSFEGFCRLVGLDQVQSYLISRRVHEIPSFSQHLLDTEGQALQNDLSEKFKSLPIRTTKAFLAVSTEKLKRPSHAYNTACELWHTTIPVILPNLLKFLSYAHSFHNPQNWFGLPPELQPVVKKILTDRFWQAGISTGSRDEFYENVSKTKSTMEGLASSIRGAIRMVRESCYSILWCMSRLDLHFYGLEELPGPLALALFADAHALSSHQMSILLNMTRYIIDDCPTSHRSHFLTPLLASLFSQVDLKVSGEWNELIERGQISQGGEDELAEEMKEESILRQLTYTAVLIVAGLLDPQRPGEGNQTQGGTIQQPRPDTGAQAGGEQPMREFILSSDVVLEPLILFCTHALRMRDSRCCGIIIRVFRSIVPEFQADRADIREFICREVLMAAIDSLHEDYFVDVQKDLAQLIATICLLYSSSSETPRKLLLSLPGLTEPKVDNCLKRLAIAQSTRHQRALFLELLDGLRGVPMSEKGRLPRVSKQRTERDKKQVQQQIYTHERQTSPDLGGVADMFA